MDHQRFDRRVDYRSDDDSSIVVVREDSDYTGSVWVRKRVVAACYLCHHGVHKGCVAKIACVE